MFEHPAPVALFVYNRIATLTEVVVALQANEHSANTTLYIFSDNAKVPKHQSAVDDVRRYIHTITGFKAIYIIEREMNFGLSQSITTGVSYVLTRHEMVIVLEDDIVTSPVFLNYMNKALREYQTVDAIAAISGYSYPTKQPLPEYFFLNRIECWGWATWADKWKLYNPDSHTLAHNILSAGLVKNFDFDNTFPFYEMLVHNAKGLNDSWAIRWDASVYLANKYVLYPGRSYARNIGMDGGGTNCAPSSSFETVLNRSVGSFADINIEFSTYSWAVYSKFYKSLKKPIWKRSYSGLIRRIKSLLFKK